MGGGQARWIQVYSLVFTVSSRGVKGSWDADGERGAEDGGGGGAVGVVGGGGAGGEVGGGGTVNGGVQEVPSNNLH